MNQLRFFLIVLIYSLGLTSCTHTVAISYLKPRQPAIPQETLANVVMIVDCPTPPDLPPSKLGFLSETEFPLDLDIDRFASKVAVFIRDRGGRLAAYRVAASNPDAFSRSIPPSSILKIHFDQPAISQTEETEVKVIKEDGREVKKEVKHWQVKGQLHMTAQLLSYPENQSLNIAERLLESSQRFETKGETRTRFEERVTKLLDDGADWTVRSVIPIDIVVRYRKLYAVDGDSVSADAREATDRGHWPEAIALWQQRLSSNSPSWTDAWDLGVAKESQSDFQAALHYYETAHSLSKVAKDAPKPEEWDSVFQDLKTIVPKMDAIPDGSGAWFSQRLAVLPFTDVSTSFDGPMNVRRLTQEALIQAGYHPMPLQDVDRILKDNGFTQGGQLGATTPGQLAHWLNADLLIYGHLEKFDEFTLGLLGWKRLNGTFKMWSTANNDYVWVSEKSVSRFSTSTAKSGRELGWSFLQQLVGSWADKASHQPMSQESAYYVNQQLLELPRRPRQ